MMQAAINIAPRSLSSGMHGIVGEQIAKCQPGFGVEYSPARQVRFQPAAGRVAPPTKTSSKSLAGARAVRSRSAADGRP